MEESSDHEAEGVMTVTQRDPKAAVRLMAAAPDLLEALVALVDAVERREGPSAPVWAQMVAAHAAIEKAKGGS